MKKYISFVRRPSFGLEEIKKILLEEDIDFITGVPKQMDLLLHFASKDNSIKSKLKQCTFYYGGASLSAKTQREAKLYFKKIIQGHGLTEAGPGVLIDQRPIEGIELKLNKKILYIKSPSICEGVDLIDGWLRTDDVFEFDGSNYYFIGRKDSFVKSSTGILFHISEIEDSVYKKFNQEIIIIMKDSKKIPFLIISNSEQQSKSVQNYLMKNFPDLSLLKQINNDFLIKKIMHSNAKSKGDVLSKLNFTEESIWVS